MMLGLTLGSNLLVARLVLVACFCAQVWILRSTQIMTTSLQPSGQGLTVENSRTRLEAFTSRPSSLEGTLASSQRPYNDANTSPRPYSENKPDKGEVLAVKSNPVSEPSSNKTLVILIGNLRGGEKAWKTLYENVLDLNSADLALFIGDTRTEYQNATLFDRAKYYWKFDEYDDWADAIDLINGTTWRQTVLPRVRDKKSGLFGGVGNLRGSGAVIFMIRYFLSQKIKEMDLVNKYERFVITRSDHFYLCKHDLSELDPNFLWLPTGKDWGGYTDRHLVVSNENVLQSLDILPPLIRNPEKYYDYLWALTFNPERLIRVRWEEEGFGDEENTVKRFKRTFFTCADAAGDTSRWSVAQERVVPEGVRLKYVPEYRQSHKVCAALQPSS